MPKEILDLLTLVALALSAIGAIGAIVVSKRVAETQKLLAQRQLLIPLWEYMSKIDDIDPNDVKPRHVQQTVNTLELVALCCEGGMVDEDVIKRTFADQFIYLFEVIQALPEIPALRRSGKQLLNENRAASAFYAKLKGEMLERDKLAKVK